MFTTLVAVVVLLILVLPGFIVNELATSRRATHPARGDLETVLRALWYSVFIHMALASTGWTLHVLQNVDDGREFEDHVSGICLFVAVAVFVLPGMLGLALGSRLRRAEQAGTLRWFDHVAGGRDARRAWDYVFGHIAAGYVVVHVKDFPVSPVPQAAGGAAGWSTIVGEISDASWASQTPSDAQDLWLPRAWPGDVTGRIVGEFDPPRGMWIAADNILAMHVLADTSDAPDGTVGRRRLARALDGVSSWIATLLDRLRRRRRCLHFRRR